MRQSLFLPSIYLQDTSVPGNPSVNLPRLGEWMYELMAAILLTRGPVCTTTCIQKNAIKTLRRTSLDQFVQASVNLQRLGLGTLIEDIKKVKAIFVKLHPDMARAKEDVLTHFCAYLDRYELRYALPHPVCVSDHVMDRVIAAGLIPVSQQVTL